MANYNTHAPQVLGNEWVPIQQADYVPDDVTERGYVLNSTGTPTVTQGGFGVADTGVSPGHSTAHLLAVYRYPTIAGFEGYPSDLTGPAKVVRLPVVASSTVTGVVTLVNAATVAEALGVPTDSKRVSFAASGANPTLSLDLFFDATAQAGQLNGKRILDVSVEYVVSGDPANAPLNAATSIGMLRTTDPARVVWAAAPVTPALGGDTMVRVGPLGELNIFWRTGAGPLDTDTEIMPWNYAQLQRFASGTGASDRLGIRLKVDATGLAAGTILFEYVALRITVCEERREMVGAWHRRQNGAQYPVGVTLTPLRRPSDLSLGVALAVDKYLVTATNVYAPDVTATPGLFLGRGMPPSMLALRQLSPSVLPLDGALVNRTVQPGVEFNTERSDILPQLTLHTATAIVANSHPYGQQVGAPVYIGVNATQRIDTTAATGGQYRHITFYARKIGPAIPSENLTVFSVQTPAATATITETAFRALPEIIDGWRKVTLTLAVPLTIAAASTQDLRWTAPVTVGGQWEILGADGPSASGGFVYGPATYGGATNQLTWQLPATGVVTADPLSDATFLLSLTPPTPTGLTGTVEQQELPASLSACGDPRCCVATTLSYVHLEWDATTLSAAGFGYWELLRQSSSDPAPVVIMQSTDINTTEFDDYETSTGPVDYFLRVYDSAGVPSGDVIANVTVTPPGIGIDGTCSTEGWLIFTTNQNPDLNCAYRMVWDNRVEEEFTFPEADTVLLSRHYQRDYQVAFRPTERGGEEFTRDLLIDYHREFASSTDHWVLANIQRLRDIAWADVPYVFVRDSDGNTWYATVIVPEGVFWRQGDHTYIAPGVRIVQVTGTPAPVTL